MQKETILKNLQIMLNYYSTNAKAWVSDIEPYEMANIDKTEGSAEAIENIIKMLETGEFDPTDYIPVTEWD